MRAAPPHTPMRDDPLFSLYKRARNRLRRYEPTSFVNQAIDALHGAELAGLQALQYHQPWNILLAVKWAFQEADVLSHRRPRARRSDLLGILRIVSEMDAVRLPHNYEHVALFMRHLAFPQFWLQSGSRVDGLIREYLIFLGLPPNHPFAGQFERLAGISLQEHLVLSYALMCVAIERSGNRVITTERFRLLEPRLSHGAVRKFFGSLSKSSAEMSSWLQGDEFRTMPIGDQQILPTPLLDTPLIETGAETYSVISPTLLMRNLESGIYRTLRKPDPAYFHTRFGPLFETFTRRCIDDANCSYLDEDALKFRLSGMGKCVDFMVLEERCNVLIDSKGVEMPRLGRVSPRADTVLRSIKESAFKAIRQAMATARRLAQSVHADLTARKQLETFVLVVTYDELYLGSSAEFPEVFASVLPKLADEFGMPLPVPLDHVFFLSIWEFEQLLLRKQRGRASVSDVLRHAHTHDGHSRTRRYMFRQHLESFEVDENRLPLLQSGLDGLCKMCIARLPNDPEV